MPIGALRLINPPSKRRKKPFPKYASRTNPKRSKAMPKKKAVKRVVTSRGVRYQLGGKFISAAKAKQIRAARKRRNLSAKVRVASGVGAGVRRKKKVNAPRKRKAAKRTVKRKVVKRVSKTRSAAAKKAAATRKRKALARSAAAKKAAATRKRRMAAKKRTPKKTPRRKPMARKKAVRRKKTTKATRAAAARRRAKAMPRYTSGPKKGKFKPSGKRRKGTRLHKGKVIRLRKSPRAKKMSSYRVRRSTRKSRRGKKTYRYGLVRMNPFKRMSAMLKSTMPIYGGLLGIRVVTALLDKYVAQRITMGATGVMAQAAPLLPSGIGFLFAAAIAPKLKVFKGKVLEGVQMGATIALFDTIIRQFVKPPLVASTNPTVSLIGNALAGYDDMGVQGYGYGAYMADPTGYSLPAAHPAGMIGMGADVSEAMAMDEYVSSVGDYQVEEALAGSELAYMQEGGAGGSMKGTVFSS